jgi:hypothetical protein
MTPKEQDKIKRKNILGLIKDYKGFAKEHERIDKPLNALECLDNLKLDIEDLKND